MGVNSSTSGAIKANGLQFKRWQQQFVHCFYERSSLSLREHFWWRGAICQCLKWNPTRQLQGSDNPGLNLVQKSCGRSLRLFFWRTLTLSVLHVWYSSLKATFPTVLAVHFWRTFKIYGGTVLPPRRPHGTNQVSIIFIASADWMLLWIGT